MFSSILSFGFSLSVKGWALFTLLHLFSGLKLSSRPQATRFKKKKGWGWAVPQKVTLAFGTQCLILGPPVLPTQAEVLRGQGTPDTLSNTPKERQCQSVFQVYCRHGHTVDLIHHAPTSHGVAREERDYIVVSRGTSRSPAGSRWGCLLTTENRPKSVNAGLRGPQEALKMASLRHFLLGVDR
jgi:hypothetical protein